MNASLIDEWIETNTTRFARTLDGISGRMHQFFPGVDLLTPDDLDILDNGLVYSVHF